MRVGGRRSGSVRAVSTPTCRWAIRCAWPRARLLPARRRSTRSPTSSDARPCSCWRDSSCSAWWPSGGCEAPFHSSAWQSACGVIVAFVAPAILDGKEPLAVAVVGSLAVMISTITLAHGVGPKSLAALLGTAAGPVPHGRARGAVHGPHAPDGAGQRGSHRAAGERDRRRAEGPADRGDGDRGARRPRRRDDQPVRDRARAPGRESRTSVSASCSRGRSTSAGITCPRR